MKVETGGFSLVETLIGLLIFSATIMMFYLSVRSSSKESVFSNNHFSALMLSQKVSEDINEEFSINPFADETLLLNSKNFGTPNLVEGNSIFFAALEDVKAPWGLIDSSTDGGIDSSHTTLYSQLKGFVLSTESKDDYFAGFSDESANLKKINLHFNWKTALDQGRIEKDFFVFAPREAKTIIDPFESLDYEALGIKNAVKMLLPSDTDFSKPMDEIISSLGASEKILFELATAQILCNNFFNSPLFLEISKENSQLTEELLWITDAKEALKKRKKLADNWYLMSQTALSVVAAVSKIFSEFDQNQKVFDAMKSLDQFQLKQYLMNVRMLYRYFLDSMIAARYNLQKVFCNSNIKIVETIEQERMIFKLLDIYRVLSFAPGHDNGQEEYLGYIARVKQMFNWKNRYIYRFFDLEENLASKPSRLVEKYPNLQHPYRIMSAQIPKTFSFINILLADKK
ncbi:MAG: type IV pilus modification PilV family protein [Candidatus Rifleibacteriota bacterium]